MATGDVYYVENKRGLAHVTKSWDGPVGQYIARQTKQVHFFARIHVPKPGGPGHGRTKINYATGKLAAGTKTDYLLRGELEGRVIAIPKHALYVHKGTAPHVIKARKAPKLVFFWHKVGRVVRFDKVNHPGQPEDPFLWKGLVRVFRRM